jgi:hypothetical protein
MPVFTESPVHYGSLSRQSGYTGCKTGKQSLMLKNEMKNIYNCEKVTVTLIPKTLHS